MRIVQALRVDAAVAGDAQISQLFCFFFALLKVNNVLKLVTLSAHLIGNEFFEVRDLEARNWTFLGRCTRGKKHLPVQ